MTKEQAIERLKAKTGILTLTVGGEETIETAIKALEEPDTRETMKEISSELEKMIDEHDGVDPYEMGISVGLSMARVVISNRRLDLEGIPR